jgi:uroporphyrin-III C-methyltransferase
VIFIGAGPGAADLITLRGAQRAGAGARWCCSTPSPIRRCAMAPQARWIDVGKRGFRHATGQPTINALLRAACARSTSASCA